MNDSSATQFHEKVFGGRSLRKEFAADGHAMLVAPADDVPGGGPGAAPPGYQPILGEPRELDGFAFMVSDHGGSAKFGASEAVGGKGEADADDAAAMGSALAIENMPMDVHCDYQTAMCELGSLKVATPAPL